MSGPSRVPAGVPTGGQFATSVHAESGVSLATIDPETITVKDRDGQDVTLTPGVLDDEARYVFSSGQCVALAVAISERTGWPVHLETKVYGKPPTGDATDAWPDSRAAVAHARVMRPDGTVIDVKGAADPTASMNYVAKVTNYGRITYMPPVAVPADQAHRLLKRRANGMVTQDVETAALFVDAVLDQADQGASA